jgi:threonine dehydrogenase-like Zn-dependent dehydrogenase
MIVPIPVREQLPAYRIQYSRAVYKSLAREFGQERFDAVINAVGIWDIFENCLDFLKVGKSYVAVGLGRVTTRMPVCCGGLGR